MLLKLILLGIITYLIYIISTFLHELNHKRKAKKYELTILSTRKQVIDHNLKNELSRCSFFILDFEFKLFGANGFLIDNEIKKLKFHQQNEILLAGIKSDLIYVIILIFIYLLISILDLINFTKIISPELNFIFSSSLFLILGKTYDNIFNECGDVQKLLKLKSIVEKK